MSTRGLEAAIRKYQNGDEIKDSNMLHRVKLYLNKKTESIRASFKNNNINISQHDSAAGAATMQIRFRPGIPKTITIRSPTPIPNNFNYDDDDDSAIGTACPRPSTSRAPIDDQAAFHSVAAHSNSSIAFHRPISHRTLFHNIFSN